MSNGRDPNLQALFSQAEQEFDSEAFGRDIMARIDRERGRARLLWSGIGVIIFACLAFAAAPLIDAVELATRLLPTSLVEVRTEWLQQLVSPINSVAAAIALGFLGLRKFFRRIFR